ncbi:MAG: DUF7601 domain-containing protein [Caldicoprobacterales bacterium]|jgi:pilin isopeptide linkage protein
MKKLLILVLVMSLVLGLGLAASAETYEDGSPVRIEKALTNGGKVNPAETFNFTVGAGAGVRDEAALDAPAFNPAAFTITVAEGGTAGFADINLPEFSQVGVYTYPITETAGNTAGMVYDSATYYLVVTVINNPDFGEENEPEFLRVLTLTDENNVKVDDFENTFNAGSLTIKKEVTGNYGDPDDEFTVVVTLAPAEGKVLKAAPITAPGGDKVINDDGTVTITYTVKDGSEFTIDNIPYDVAYTVEEPEPGAYEVSYVNESGEIEAATTETTITNHRDLEIATGINLDSLPYILILAIAVGGLALLIVRKRMAVSR